MNYVQVRIYLTPEQKEWLGNQPKSFSLSAECRKLTAHLMEMQQNEPSTV